MAILRINGLSTSFGIKTVFENVSFDIRSGERIGLVGANGAGKTTLLKCIRGDEEYDKGSVKASDGAIIGYLRQDFNYTSHTIREEMEEAWRDVLFYKDRIEALTKELEQHKDDEKLIEQYGKAEERFEFLGGYDYESMTKKILTGLGFTQEDWDRDIHAFSGGQKVRINLAAAFVRHPDFLLLDEPTNHLDIPTREIMEQAIQAFGGTSLVISHDRYFLDKITTRIVEMEHGKLTEYLGNYSYYKEKKLDLEAFEKDRSGEETVEEEPEEDKTAPEKEHQKKQEVSAVEREKLSHVEMEIGRLEATVKMYTAQMSMDPDNYADLAAEYDEAQKKLEALYEKWDELAAKME